jgi:DNA-binding XRE family transcriptional regulator
MDLPCSADLAALERAMNDVRARVEAVVAAATLPDLDGSPSMGKLVHQRRKELGLSLEEVAKAADCSKSHVWEIEQDRSRNPTVAMVWALACALMVPFPVMAAAALKTHLAAQAAAD